MARFLAPPVLSVGSAALDLIIYVKTSSDLVHNCIRYTET